MTAQETGASGICEMADHVPQFSGFISNPERTPGSLTAGMLVITERFRSEHADQASGNSQR